jgi:hypothetical protein
MTQCIAESGEWGSEVRCTLDEGHIGEHALYIPGEKRARLAWMGIEVHMQPGWTLPPCGHLECADGIQCEARCTARPPDSWALCIRPLNHEGLHRPISAEEWSDS